MNKAYVEHLRQKFSTEDNWDKEMLTRELAILEREVMALTPVLVGGKKKNESITEYVNRGRALQDNALNRYNYIKNKLEAAMETAPVYNARIYAIEGKNVYVLATSIGHALSKIVPAMSLSVSQLNGGVTIGVVATDPVVYEVVTNVTSFIVTSSYDNLLDILKTPEYTNVQSVRYKGSVIV